MYAIVKCGGQQLKVAQGDVITINQVSGDAGSSVNLDVLMVVDGANVKVGTPLLAGATVAAEVVEHKRGKKVMVFKMRRRKNYRRTKGHRQELTVLKITGINVK